MTRVHTWMYLNATMMEAIAQTLWNTTLIVLSQSLPKLEMVYAMAAPTGPKNVEWTEEIVTDAVPHT